MAVDSSGQMTRLIIANGCNYGDTRHHKFISSFATTTIMYTIKSIKTCHTATLPTWPFVTCYIIWNIVGLQSNSNIMMNMEDSIYTCLRPCHKTNILDDNNENNPKAGDQITQVGP